MKRIVVLVLALLVSALFFSPFYSSAIAINGESTYAVIHYFRADGDYGDHTTGDFNAFWGLYLWEDIEEFIEWTTPKPFLGEDEYGRFAWVKLATNAKNVGFIVHRGDLKDPGPDQSFEPLEDATIWLQ